MIPFPGQKSNASPVSVMDHDAECRQFRAQGLTVTTMGEWEGEKEIWVKVPEFEGYELSTLGRMKNKRGLILRFVKGKEGSGKDYWKTNLSVQGVYTTVRIHQLVMKTFGVRPESDEMLVVDHINQNKLDNRLSNLRWLTVSQNGMNSKMWTSNTSGTKGVYWVPSRKRFLALIHFNKKKEYLGYYETKEEAEAARRAAERRLCGDFLPRGDETL